MKGHLGYRCRVCLPPSSPTNFRQSNGWILWDAPSSQGSNPVSAYVVERYLWSADNPQWEVVAEIYDTANRQYNAEGSLCRSAAYFRVRAVNQCGISGYTESLTVNPRVPTQSEQIVLVTSSGTVMPPCWATSIKIWCVGRGGSSVAAEYGGGGGGLAWRSWTNNTPNPWTTPISCTIQNNYVGNDEPRTSVTFDGATFYARHAEGQQSAGYGGDADGGEYGAPGGESSSRYLTQYSFLSGASQYAYVPGTQPEDHRYYFFGGGLGGGDPLPPGAPSLLVDSGVKLYPYPVSPCMRHPAHDRSGLLAAAALAGLRVTESCEADAAFGSGASKWPIVGTTSPYGGYQWQYNSAGYGGGGFAGTPAPGGPACILIGFNL